MPPASLQTPAAVLAYRDLLRQLRSQRGDAASTSASASATAGPHADLYAAAAARLRARVAAYAAARADRSETGRALTRLTARVGEARRAWAAARRARVEALRADLAAAAAATAAGGELLVGAARDARAAAREIKAVARERLRAAVVASREGGEDDDGNARHPGDLSTSPAPAPALLSPSDAALLGSDGLARTVVTRGITALSRAFMSAATDTAVGGRAGELADALQHRPPGQALLTVSNHASALDDPLIVSALMPPGLEANPAALRWTLCATDRCFTNPAASAFFRAGKVLPVARGAGLDQPGMRAAEALLARGDWVHVFPEGTRSRDGRVRPARKGVGRLAVAAARAAAAAGAPPPLLIPFAHAGMHGVHPPGTAIPRPGGHVSIAVGEPIPVAAIAAAHAAAGAPGGEDGLYLAVAAAVGRALAGLHAGLVAGSGEVAALDGSSSPWAVDSDVLMPLLANEAAAAAPAWPAAAAGGAAAARAPGGWRAASSWLLGSGRSGEEVALSAPLPRSPRRTPSVAALAAAVGVGGRTATGPPSPQAELLQALRGGGGGGSGLLAAYARARAAAAVRSLGEEVDGARRRLAFA